MRVSDNLEKGQVVAHAVSAVALVVVAVLAALQSFGANVFSSRWARLASVLALVGATYVGLNRDFYMPFLGPTVVPTSVLKLGTPADAAVSLSVDAPAKATHVVYWAAGPSTMPSPTPIDAYAGFKNAGVVPVAGRRATLRLACPGAYKVGWGRLLPRHVHYRYVFTNGVMSAVKTAPVTCAA
jgi:hypothetical protein